MCAMCDGQAVEEFVAGVAADIERIGWSVIAVEGERGWPGYAYTVGLTRYHGHPELIVSGLDADTALLALDDVGARVRDGGRVVAGERFVPPDGPGVECLVLPVIDPSRLVLAQSVYGAFFPVTALQIVWSDEGGRWPWQMCDHHRRGQEVFGPPPGSWD